MVIAIRSMAIGAFASWAEAEHAISGLLGERFGLDQVGIVLPDGLGPRRRIGEAGPTALWVGGMIRS